MLSNVDIKYFKMAVGLDNIGKQSDVDITAKCPICGDSTKKKNLKRLHLYNKGTVTNVNCFNGGCSVNNKTMYSFLRDFYPNLFSKYRKETFSETLSKLAKGDDVFSKFAQNDNVVSNSHDTVIVHDLSPYFSEINDDVISYLNTRNIKYNEMLYGKWYYGHQNLKIDNVLYNIAGSIIVPLYYCGVMYGFYSRSLREKYFVTYMNDANIGYKLWNWFNIKKDEPVYIFEGIFDAISSGKSNIIAAIGAKIPQERIDELKEPIFVYDNDKTGLDNSLKMALRGYTVYIQPDNIIQKDMNAISCETDYDVSELIDRNLFSGISAEVRIKSKM